MSAFIYQTTSCRNAMAIGGISSQLRYSIPGLFRSVDPTKGRAFHSAGTKHAAVEVWPVTVNGNDIVGSQEGDISEQCVVGSASESIAAWLHQCQPVVNMA